MTIVAFEEYRAKADEEAAKRERLERCFSLLLEPIWEMRKLGASDEEIKQVLKVVIEEGIEGRAGDD